MSKEGIKTAAEVFSHMQQARNLLLAMGTKDEVIGTKEGHQDILLGQMLLDAKDFMKTRFERLTK